MFVEWGFLLTEIWALLALAALLGLVAGWLIFGGKSSAGASSGDADRLRAENAKLQSRIVTLEAQGAGAIGSVAAAATTTPALKKPRQLDEPNGGKADDLKRIKGVGPRMEQMCNMLGFWHYDQIANWTDEEVKWVDENLQGFQGRVTRDDWRPQAKILAAGGETEFSKEHDAKAEASKKAKEDNS